MSKWKIQIQRRNGIWTTLPDTSFDTREKAEAYGNKYFTRRFRVVYKSKNKTEENIENYCHFMDQII